MILSEAYCMDNLEFMRQIPNKFYKLAVVDPPYGLDKKLSQGGGAFKNTPMRVLYNKGKKWDIVPTAEYWNHLFRISEHQIVFGANYFIEYLKNTRGIICWDKQNFLPTMSSWEFAWTSFDTIARTYTERSTDPERVHSTQKPVGLYKWIFETYAEKGWNIFDSHLGSGSSRIAAWALGFDFTATEADEYNFNEQEKRFKRYKESNGLFINEFS